MFFPFTGDGGLQVCGRHRIGWLLYLSHNQCETMTKLTMLLSCPAIYPFLISQSMLCTNEFCKYERGAHSAKQSRSLGYAVLLDWISSYKTDYSLPS